jgi:hypothetical protein
MTQTPTTQSKPLQLLRLWATEKEDYLSLLTERMEVQKKWAYGEDQARAEYYKPKYLLTKELIETLQVEIQEAKEALQVYEREQRLKEAVQTALSWTWDYTEGNMLEVRAALTEVMSTLYPDTPAQPASTVQEITARPIDEWHEECGDVLWWTFPLEESPYCGSPLDEDWPGYHTHWTPFVFPTAPAPKEGTP